MPIPRGYQSPVRMSAKEKAFHQLQRWIIDGTLEPGEQLFDTELSEALGISRTPVREALQLLQTQGFIETYPGRETKVTTITKEDVPKIYPPLAALQALAAEEAARKIATGDIRRLVDVNNDYRTAIGEEQLFQAMEHDEQFHDLILEIADNPYITQFSSILQLHLRRLKYVFLQQPVGSKTESVLEHERMIRAFENRDSETAAAIMRQNWLRPMQEVYEVLVRAEQDSSSQKRRISKGDNGSENRNSQ
ncbi:GntR family transcriptional regulator [Brevibacillus borstelensis]|uniref:GntR family transcriptional regulator n=1 Tax=Brevibacillus borstelensis TaxID=45462 RepID=UPI002E1F1EEF|nr:GntR family transcriptional regulator [Brevibacillus borstelensis]